MCKYCKRLKELKDLADLQWQKIVTSWKYRDLKARVMFTRLLEALDADEYPDEQLLKDVQDFIDTDWVGK